MAHSGLELIANKPSPPPKFYKTPGLPKPKRLRRFWGTLDVFGLVALPLHWNQRRLIVSYDIACQYRHPPTQQLLEDERAIQSF
ncbi:hypothetical protein B0H13DRAFT_2353749 [Mycena leptocephala]|nr:hypothetical protein B0H13DRAFT_2353749 [Mycena leptocephala]